MSSKKILVVEDDLIIQLFIEFTIKKVGFEVVGSARSCNEAIEILKKTKPDFILLDIGLIGNKDGIDTAEIINSEFKIPFIFMTGNTDEATLNRAKKANPLGFIFKPMDEYGLISNLKALDQ